MTDVTEVKRALARLARREAPRSIRISTCEPASTIYEAEAAIGDLDRAARFAAAGGRTRLEAAIERVEQTGRRDLLRRGQHAQNAFERFEEACRSDGEENR